MWRVLDFLDYIRLITVVDVEFGFHFKYFVLEEAADLFGLGVVDSQKLAPDLEFVVVRDFHLFESYFVHFGEEVEKAPVGEV